MRDEPMRLVRLSGRTVVNVDAIVRVSESFVQEAGEHFRDVKVRYLDGTEEVFGGEEADSLRVFLARNSEPVDGVVEFTQGDGGEAPRPLISKSNG
jgi:hypothetical protein